jgi:CRP-like cAMP-binding protein
MFLVRSGTATMRRHGKRIGTIRAPGAVGFISLLARTAGGTSAVADSPIESFELRADAMEEIFEDHFPILLRTMRFIADWLVWEAKDQEPLPYRPPAVPFDQLIGEGELGIVERIYLLRCTSALAAANLNSIASLARRMEEVRVGPGHVLWSPGDRSSESYFIVKGMARITSKDGARVQVVGPGYTVGGPDALIGAPRWNELRTDEPVVAFRSPIEALVDVFEDDQDLALRFLSMFATNLMRLHDRKAEAGIAAVGTGPAEAEQPPAQG